MTFLAVISPWCWAQQPVPDPAPDVSTEPASPIFNADRVLITTFQPLDDASESDANRLFDLLSNHLSQSNEVVSMTEVPRFVPQGYGGEEYMTACPPEKYGGCALVLGQRVESDRAIGATIRREEDEFEAGASIVIMTVFIIDVLEAREIASFGVPLTAEHEMDAIVGIARVFDDVVKGDYELRDMRKRGITPDEAALEEARKERLALTLSALEEQLGTSVRSETIRAPDRRLTRADIEEYSSRDETPPWERVGMSPNQYIRFANSGEDLDAWRSSGWGRFGKVTLRAMFGFGSGPWHQSYESQVLLSGVDLEPVQTVQFLELNNASSYGTDLEIGFGVAPFADISFAAGLRNGQTSLLSGEAVQGQFARPPNELRQGISTWQYGARGQLSPFPRWPVRPTLAAGIAYWRGKGIASSERFERLEAPNALFVELLPGVEADASPLAAFSLRLLESIPVAGTFVRTSETGEPLMEDPPTPTRDYGPGIGLQAGVLFRLGPLIKPPAPQVSSFDDDEP